ncbi:MAG: retropepsin-like domain-containing protein [Candidatus Rokubacteria bacterium]|nr:retropepsin-like domain-containing protein [Candidatus Rokubacteria bacterium]
MRRRYSTAFEPPAPVVPIVVRAPGGVDSVEVDGKVDTGADVCTLPLHIARRLDLPAVRVARASGFSGAPLEVIVYAADFDLDDHRLEALDVLVTERPYALLGRNLLRRAILHLDGPRGWLDLRVVSPGRRRPRRD